MTVRLAGIISNSNANGLGTRDVLFAQGCNHKCEDCFNKHTWSFNDGKLCDCDEIIKQCIERSYLAGITFSGGDPFYQPEAFAYIAKELKKNNINIWCYTGYTWEELMLLSIKNQSIKQLLENIDVLIDGPFIKKLKSDQIDFRGSINQRIIDVQKTLKEGKTIIDQRFK